MVDECASCEVDDELLFTCSYCEERFCSEHQFPHHGCEGFGRAAEAGVPDVDAEWLPASALGEASVGTWEVESTDATESGTTARTSPGATAQAVTESTADADAGGESSRPVTVSPPEPSRRAESLSAGTWRDGPPPGAGNGVVNVRPMDSRRVVGGTEAGAAPRTVGDWISRQTYLTLLLKVGIVSLLVNSAFYGGMAVTMYGLLPFTL